MISLYYSPHRWMREQEGGGFDLDARNEPIDLQEFEALVSSNHSISDLLDTQNIPARLMLNTSALHASGASVSLLNFANLQSGLKRFGRKNGFDLSDIPAEKVNSSAGQQSDCTECRSNGPFGGNRPGFTSRQRSGVLSCDWPERLLDSVSRWFNLYA